MIGSGSSTASIRASLNVEIVLGAQNKSSGYPLLPSVERLGVVGKTGVDPLQTRNHQSRTAGSASVVDTNSDIAGLFPGVIMIEYIQR